MKFISPARHGYRALMINEFRGRENIDCKYDTGCFDTGDEWLKKFSMEDDGELSRISAMSGHDIARTERKLQKLGLQPPEVTEDAYKYTDYYIYALEYQPHKLIGLTFGSPPNWLIWHDLSFNINTGARPAFAFNHGVKIS